MVTIDKNKPVCVTGASGYIASWIVKDLLDKGFVVHATVRDSNKASSVAHLWKLADGSKGTLKLFDADLIQPGSFKAAIEVIRARPLAGYAVLTIALSHMVMVSVMSMTPAHLSSTGHSLSDVGLTISLHIAGMYAFAPVFGMLTDRLGPVKTIVLGQMVFLVSIAFAGLGQNSFEMVIIGLFLLGLGWSASTVAGSALLSEVLPTDEKASTTKTKFVNVD